MIRNVSLYDLFICNRMFVSVLPKLASYCVVKDLLAAILDFFLVLLSSPSLEALSHLCPFIWRKRSWVLQEALNYYRFLCFCPLPFSSPGVTNSLCQTQPPPQSPTAPIQRNTHHQPHHRQYQQQERSGIRALGRPAVLCRTPRRNALKAQCSPPCCFPTINCS